MQTVTSVLVFCDTRNLAFHSIAPTRNPDMNKKVDSASAVSVLQLIHFDLKSANVLLQDKNFNVAKIADLGLSKCLLEHSVLNRTARVPNPLSAAASTCVPWLQLEAPLVLDRAGLLASYHACPATARWTHMHALLPRPFC